MTHDYVKEQLPKWLRAVELEPGGDRLAAIESSAIHLGSTLSGRDVLDMILLAHGQSHGNAFDHLNHAVRTHDPTFGCRADDLESTVAASAAVSALLAQESKSASIAAQGILSADWLGLSPAVTELPGLASATSHRRSEALRKRRAVSRPRVKTFFDDAPEFNNTGNPVTQREGQLLRAAAKKAVDALQTRQDSLAGVMAARLDAADEELDLLWWASSDYSELAKTKWVDIAPQTAAVLSGIELGNKLVFEIELPSTDALLARLLGRDLEEPVALAEAVEGSAALVDLKMPTDGHPLLPILSSISEHRTLGGDPSWKGSVGRWNIDPGHSAGKLAFARQSVRERTLIGHISDD